MEALLADLQGGAMSPRRKALYSLLFLLAVMALYWTGLSLAQHALTMRDSLAGSLDSLAAAQSGQLADLAARLARLEQHSGRISSQLEEVAAQLREGAEGNR